MDIVQHLSNAYFSYLHEKYEKYAPLQENCQIAFTDYGIMGIAVFHIVVLLYGT